MSSKPDMRDPLPQDDSLNAFAAAAFGPRRARKPRPEKSREQATAPAVEEPVEKAPEPAGEKGSAEAAVVEEPVATAAPAEPAPAPEAVPAPAPAVEDHAATATIESAPPAEPTPTPPPAPAAPGREVATRPSPAPAVVRRTRPARRDGTVRIEIPDLGPEADRATQCTVMVSATVRERFAHYQLAKKNEKGTEPTNAVVVRRAVLHARKHDLFPQLLDAVRQRHQPVEDEDDDPDDLFGAVPGRRVERGRIKDSVQQSFRPSLRELAVIDAIVTAYGFPSRSDFLDAALDAFLPPLPAGD